MRYNADMASKIRIISGFASPREVAKELGVSKAELRTIEDILNKPAVRKKSPRNASGAFVTRRSPTKNTSSDATALHWMVSPTNITLDTPHTLRSVIWCHTR